MNIQERLAAVKQALETGKKGRFSDEEILDLYLKHGTSKAAALAAGKTPSNFHARLQLAIRRIEAGKQR